MGKIFINNGETVDFVGQPFTILAFDKQRLVFQRTNIGALEPELLDADDCFRYFNFWLKDSPDLKLYFIDYGSRSISYRDEFLKITELERELISGINLKKYFENFIKI